MTADKLYVNAKDAQLNGDEEKAYVLYMRYYHVLKGIWKDSLYKSKKVCVCVCVCVCARVHACVCVCHMCIFTFCIYLLP